MSFFYSCPEYAGWRQNGSRLHLQLASHLPLQSFRHSVAVCQEREHHLISLPAWNRLAVSGHARERAEICKLCREWTQMWIKIVSLEKYMKPFFGKLASVLNPWSNRTFGDQILQLVNSQDCFYISLLLLTAINIASIDSIGETKLVSLNNWWPNEGLALSLYLNENPFGN